MLRLKKVKIKNFRCFEDTGWISIEPGFTALIGMNEAGKSAFLRAISYLGAKEDIPKKDWRDGEYEPEVIGVFEVSPEHWKTSIPKSSEGLLKLLGTIRYAQVKESSNAFYINFYKNISATLNHDRVKISGEKIVLINEALFLPYFKDSEAIKKFQDKITDFEKKNVVLPIKDAISKVSNCLKKNAPEDCRSLFENLKNVLDKIFIEPGDLRQQRLLPHFQNSLTFFQNKDQQSAIEHLELLKNEIKDSENNGHLLSKKFLMQLLSAKNIKEAQEITENIKGGVNIWKYSDKTELNKLLAEISSFLEDPVTLKDLVYDSINTIYFDEYNDELPDKLSTADAQKNKMVTLLIEIARGKLEVFSMSEGMGRREKSDKIAQDFTKELSKYWNQDPIRTSITVDGKTVEIGVINIDKKGQNSEIKSRLPSERSRGMQWYLNFFIKFLGESGRGHKNSILLLDDVAVHLHAKGQKGLLNLFKTMSDHNQIIYSTHFPFLVPPDLSKVRTFKKRGAKAKIFEKISAIDPGQKDAIAPVRAMLGVTLGDSLFSGRKTLIVEGISDMYYLQALSRYRKKFYKDNLENIQILPAGNAHSATLFARFHEKEGLHYVLIIDADQSGRGCLEALKRDYGEIIEDKAWLLDEAVGKPLENKRNKMEMEDFIEAGFSRKSESNNKIKRALAFSKFLDDCEENLFRKEGMKKFWGLCDKLFETILKTL